MAIDYEHLGCRGINLPQFRNRDTLPFGVHWHRNGVNPERRRMRPEFFDELPELLNLAPWQSIGFGVSHPLAENMTDSNKVAASNIHNFIRNHSILTLHFLDSRVS